MTEHKNIIEDSSESESEKASNYLTPKNFEETMYFLKARGSSEHMARNLALMQVLYKTGLPLSDVASLTVGMVFTSTGEIRERVNIPIRGRENQEDVRVVILMDYDLRSVLEEYYKDRQRKSAELNYNGVGFSENDRLFLNDQNQEFSLASTRQGKDGKSYKTYVELSLLIRDLHTIGGFPGGTADMARRSWTMWMALGLDGRTPVPLEFLRRMRGDLRTQATLNAIRRLEKDYDPHSNELFELFVKNRNRSFLKV